MKTKNLTIILFSLILIPAIFLRVFKLDQVPPALFGDEIDVGYQAYSLWETGRDLTGRFMPFYLKSLSEYRTPLYIYSAAPFVGIFGLNEWGVRLPAVFWGLLSIVGMFLLSRKLFNSKVGLLTMSLMSFSPWHLQYSRASFEVTMLLSFLIFGAYFFLKGLEKNRYFILSAILFTSSIYIYSTAVVFTPLLTLLLVLIYWKQIFKINLKKIALVIITGLVILLPLGISMVTGEAKERFTTVSIFQDKVLIDKLNLARKGEEYYSPEGEVKKTDPKLEMFFHNKATVFTQVFLTNYFKAINPLFLFADGDITFRHSIHEMGQEYYFEAILLIIGAFALVRLERKKSILVFGWLLIAPIPASLTDQGGSHATRLIIMLPVIALISGLGANWILERWKPLYGKAIAISLVTVVILNMTFYFHRYYIHYAPESWRWWHVGYKEAMLYMKSVENDYQLVGFNNTYEPSLIRFLFWNKIDPSLFHEKYLQTIAGGEVLPGYKGFMMGDKYFFGTSGEKSINETIPQGMLYMASARDEVPGNWDWVNDPPGEIKVLKTVYDPLGKPIFYIITKK